MPVDQGDDGEEAAASTATDAGARNGNRQMALAGTGAARQHGVAPRCDKPAAGEVAHERLGDRRATEFKIFIRWR